MPTAPSPPCVVEAEDDDGDEDCAGEEDGEDGLPVVADVGPRALPRFGLRLQQARAQHLQWQLLVNVAVRLARWIPARLKENGLR